MPITTAQYQELRRDLTRVFARTSKTVKTVYDRFCTPMPSDGESENYAWLGAMPNVRKWVGPRVFKELRGFDFSLRNETWESSLLFNLDKYNDGKAAGFGMQTRDLASKAVKHPNKLWFETVNENRPCFDGQDFFDTDHAAGDSGNQANVIDFEVVDPTNPTPAEMRDAFHAGLIQLLGFRDDTGEPFVELDGQPLGDLSVLCPLVLYPQTNAAFASTLIVTDGAAGSNIVLEKPTVVPSVRVGSGYTGGDDTHIDLMYTGDEIKPYIFQQREALRFDLKGAEDIEFNELKAMTKSRYACGPFAWWFACRINLV